ncbi:MAG TPA: GNAT family N-acetyltransferase [Verrucomicrobiae bacterium]|nr:GNAT family N-acetyltransferase [Verrucomicrobiae bacterium]
MTRLALRYLTDSDLPFADSLRAVAGWNQTIADWQRFLALSPRGCLLAECEGRPVATAVTVAYGTELGWIGMMLVHPDFRRRGIARVLMDHSIEVLRNAGVKSIKLDATPAGREVYLRIGFKDEYTLTRYEGIAPSSVQNASVREARVDDLARILVLDQAATGAPRENLLRRLLGEASRATVYHNKGEITGFGFARAGSLATYVGPIVAADRAQAEQIASTLANGKTFCDLPDGHSGAAAWAKCQNFMPQRILTRMYLGENVQPTAPETYFAIAAPDLG